MMMLHSTSPKGPTMAAEVAVLAQRSGFKMGSDLSEQDKAQMRHLRLHERIEVPVIARRFNVSRQTAYWITTGFAPDKQKIKPASPAWAARVIACLPELRKQAKLLARTPDRTDDLVQDTLVRALEKEALFQPQDGKPLIAWLSVIMRNLHLTGFRRWREIEDIDGSFAAKYGERPAQGDAFDLQRLHEAIGRLPSIQAEAVRLIALQGLSYEDAARVAGANLGTMKSRLHRARASLALETGLDPGDFCTDGLLASAMVEI